MPRARIYRGWHSHVLFLAGGRYEFATRSAARNFVKAWKARMAGDYATAERYVPHFAGRML